MMRLTCFFRHFAVPVGALLFLAPKITAQTVTNTWLGGTNLWDTPANWSAGAVPNQIGNPGSSFRVVIGSGAPTLAADVTVDFVDMTGATLNGGGFNLEVLQGITFSGPVADSLANINLTFTGGRWTQGDIALSAGATMVSRGLFILEAANTMTMDASSSWRNEGILTTTADQLTTIGGNFVNAGTVLVPQGGLQVVNDVVQESGDLILLGISGQLTLASPTAADSTEIHIKGGSITGTGEVGKNIRVESNGLLSPGTVADPYGHITSRGNLTLEAGSRVLINIGGPLFNPPTLQYDRFEAGGSLRAEGFLQVQLEDGFEPAPGDRFLIAVSNGNMSVSFSNVAVGQWFETADGGGSFRLVQENRNLYLQEFIPIPEPGVAVLVLLGAGVLRLRR
ncbi:MAG: hypothetical protein ACKVYV_17950, partial [Limisphaerales bacterium]